MNQSEAQEKYGQLNNAMKKLGIGMAYQIEKHRLKGERIKLRQDCLDQGIVLLEPCPFCGSYDVELQNDQGQHIWYSVDCESCQVEGPANKDIDAAIAAWNTRVN